ncbi:MAG: hypothetical protein FWD12_10155 [Alphaproteobacteria bacterium]|nr:hypothetical protein [Alphaproteobacteria bacterium]
MEVQLTDAEIDTAEDVARERRVDGISLTARWEAGEELTPEQIDCLRRYYLRHYTGALDAMAGGYQPPPEEKAHLDWIDGFLAKTRWSEQPLTPNERAFAEIPF